MDKVPLESRDQANGWWSKNQGSRRAQPSGNGVESHGRCRASREDVRDFGRCQKRRRAQGGCAERPRQDQEGQKARPIFVGHLAEGGRPEKCRTARHGGRLRSGRGRASNLVLKASGRLTGSISVAHALSGPTRTSCLPKLAPFNSPMKAEGALSSPSVTNSLYLTLPSRTHCDMSRRKSA